MVTDRGTPYETWLHFAKKVYGKTFDPKGVSSKKWQRWYGHNTRIRVRFADGTVRDGLVGITRGPEPMFVFRRYPTSNGGIRLTERDRVIATQGPKGKGYLPYGRKR